MLAKKVSVGKKVSVSSHFVVPGYLKLKALRHGSHSFNCNYTNACLYLVSIHQMAPPQTEVEDI